MSPTKRPTAKKPLASASAAHISSSDTPRAVLEGVDVFQLSEWVLYNLDDAASGGFTRLYEELRETFITSKDNPVETLHFARLLEHVDAFTGVETATRQAAFVIGFECCRRLLLGELDLPALKKAHAFKEEKGGAE